MSRDFYWFKDMEYAKAENETCENVYEVYKTIFYDGHNTSHSDENIRKVQEMLEKHYCRIPYFDAGYVAINSLKPELVHPLDMCMACCKILNSEMKYPEMRERIEWFKKLSEQNYFLAYDRTF